MFNIYYSIRNNKWFSWKFTNDVCTVKSTSNIKEATGNMMTLSYNVGLTVGSLINYVFESMLGPPIENPCPVYPFAPMSPSVFNTTSTTTVATAIIPIVTSTLKPIISTLRTTIATTKRIGMETRIIQNGDSKGTEFVGSATAVLVSTIASIVTNLNSNSTNNNNSTAFNEIIPTNSTSIALPLTTVLSTIIFNSNATMNMTNN